jgi:hypothetical protein
MNNGLWAKNIKNKIRIKILVFLSILIGIFTYISVQIYNTLSYTLSNTRQEMDFIVKALFMLSPEKNMSLVNITDSDNLMLS